MVIMGHSPDTVGGAASHTPCLTLEGRRLPLVKVAQHSVGVACSVNTTHQVIWCPHDTASANLAANSWHI